jgi:hypothetical protein
VYILIAARALGTSVVRLVRSISGVLEATVLMAAVCVATKSGLGLAGLDALQRLPVEVLVSALVFAGACAVRQPEVLDEARRMRRLRAGAQPEADPLPASS